MDALDTKNAVKMDRIDDSSEKEHNVEKSGNDEVSILRVLKKKVLICLFIS